MLERAVLPDLRRRSGETRVIVSRVLRTWGESESGLNERLPPLIERLDEAGNPTLAFLASGWEGLKVRLTAKAASAPRPRRSSTSGTPRSAPSSGELVFGVDDDTMESVVLDLLRERGLTLGLAESVTGGLVAARLTGDRRAPATCCAAAVVSATPARSSSTCSACPRARSVTPEAAAAHGRRAPGGCSGPTSGSALTGVAGPAEQEGQPVGTLHVGLALGDGGRDASRCACPASASRCASSR